MTDSEILADLRTRKHLIRNELRDLKVGCSVSYDKYVDTLESQVDHLDTLISKIETSN